jgi:COP9 signalosome complex subunit 12
MDALIREFRKAYAGERGNDLAKTITPDLTDSPEKLLSVWGSARNAQAIKDDLQFLFVRDKSAQLRMSREEAQGWQEVYLAYWKALGEILAVEGRREDGALVCVLQGVTRQSADIHKLCLS